MTTAQSPSRVFTAADLLNSASSAAMEGTLFRIRRRFRQWNRWLTARHPYGDVIKALQPKGKVIDGTKLAEYIASSIPLHLADGWTYLARAFDAVRSGDSNTAVHLAYYAELRAAMSLLASEGVGVFNDRHVAIGPTFAATDWSNLNSNRGRRVGTHLATWELLGSWADDPKRAATILTAIKVESRTISEWFDAAQIGQSVQHIVARRWLKAWSLDLTLFSVDRDRRNYTSYRPNHIAPNSATSIDADADVICPLLQTWPALEPSGNGGAAIDVALLFRALFLAFNRPFPLGEDWHRFIDRLGEAASTGLQTQLKNPAVMDNYVLRWADNSANPPASQAVLARATLLLRIANGVCAQRLANAQVSKQDIQFWWTRFGEDGGLWSDTSEPEYFADLWGEVNDAIGDAESALQSVSSSKPMSEICPIFGRGVALTQYSRVPLWLLGVD